MNYNLLEEMGIGNFDLTYLFIAAFALIFILIIITIVQTVRLGKLSKRYKKVM